MNKDYKYIKTVADNQGLTKAAEQLFISVPALSKFIKNKENDLGVAIFIRDGKKFKLTFEGQKYLEYEKKVSLLKQSFENQILNHNQFAKKTLRIGFPLSLARVIVNKVLKVFDRRYPNTLLQIHEDKVVNLNRMLEKDQLDLIITMKDINHPDDYEVYPLVEGQVALIGANTEQYGIDAKYRPAFNYPWIDINVAKKIPIIGLRKHSYYLELFKAYLLTEANEVPSINVTLSTIEHVLLAVKQEIGWAPLPDFLVKLSGYKNLDMYSFGKEPLNAHLQIICTKETSESPATQEFIKICQDKFREEAK